MARGVAGLTVEGNKSEKIRGRVADPRLSARGIEPYLTPLFEGAGEQEVCCGPPPAPPSSVFERPGYRLLSFVDGFASTPVGPVPKVTTTLDRGDLLGTLSQKLPRVQLIRLAIELLVLFPRIARVELSLTFSRLLSSVNIMAASEFS